MPNWFSFLTSDAKQLAAAKKVCLHAAELLNARFSIRLWDGTLVPLGQDVDPEMCVAIRTPGVISSMLRRPTLDNLIRHYAVGNLEIQGGDLMKFGEIVRVRKSRDRLKTIRKGLLFRNALPFLLAPGGNVAAQHAYEGDVMGRGPVARPNQDYVQFHYDLGNEFYQLFLDPEMHYSCAYFRNGTEDLNSAQEAKLDLICRKLRLQPGERMLDIGCGWGGLICHAALNYGVQAHGVTLSQAQYDFAVAKVRRLGLEDRVTVELRDFNTLDGTYDKISSIGMYEHVGVTNYPKYFGKIYSLLRDRGILLNHGITRGAKTSRRKFARIRPEHRLFAKYIFPGGELDHIGHTCESLEASRFEVHDVENWREHYALTTRFWCERLTARKDEAIAMVGPERYRLWIAYLAGVSYMFQDGSMRIFQVVASKHAAKGRAELPPTRADLYRRAS